MLHSINAHDSPDWCRWSTADLQQREKRDKPHVTHHSHKQKWHLFPFLFVFEPGAKASLTRWRPWDDNWRGRRRHGLHLTGSRLRHYITPKTSSKHMYPITHSHLPSIVIIINNKNIATTNRVKLNNIVQSTNFYSPNQSINQSINK